jgi:flavin-dependent dehydrogenase
MLIDASGQSSLVASRLRLRRMDAALKNFAVFSHFTGAGRGAGEREGDISVVLVPGGWWWVIPLAGDKTSVGLVAPAHLLAGRKPDEAFFAERIEATPYLRQRLCAARRIAPVRTASDYSYVCSRFAGDRWVLVGDAAGFIDPVFSTGVYLGISSALRAAAAVDRALSKRRLRRGAFRGYERWLGRAFTVYRGFVQGFYTPEFVEVLMHPSDRLQLRQAVTSLLAGYGVDHFDVTWRIWIFRAITRLNRRLELTPRLAGRREATAL